jgi:2-oxoglutarate dehydrogenase complex dehydrogenase (E1) component-like enzyme
LVDSILLAGEGGHGGSKLKQIHVVMKIESSYLGSFAIEFSICAKKERKDWVFHRTNEAAG